MNTYENPFNRGKNGSNRAPIACGHTRVPARASVPFDGRQTSGACPGYRKDHIVPLACGGPDAVLNIQWQTIPEARAKDAWELALLPRAGQPRSSWSQWCTGPASKLRLSHLGQPEPASSLPQFR